MFSLIQKALTGEGIDPRKDDHSGHVCGGPTWVLSTIFRTFDFEAAGPIRTGLSLSCVFSDHRRLMFSVLFPQTVPFYIGPFAPLGGGHMPDSGRDEHLGGFPAFGSSLRPWSGDESPC